jgi:hypothetical protein
MANNNRIKKVEIPRPVLNDEITKSRLPRRVVREIRQLLNSALWDGVPAFAGMTTLRGILSTGPSKFKIGLRISNFINGSSRPSSA